MRTTFVMDPPPAVEDLIAERHALGQDLYDEVWEGEYHVAPAPSGGHARIQARLIEVLRPLALTAGLDGGGPCNVGGSTDYRVPDLAFIRDWRDEVWYPEAAIVVEIASPGDESRAKLDFYFRHGADEVLIVEPLAHTVEWLVRGLDGLHPADGSVLLGITSAELAASMDWPR